ncbi:MAG: UvrD-helicase domain-containing protein [Gammaproteobacteria bacterium]|nr:UvrD-helicase domain-containing protein [Gammaproteobacteria bacterium]
MTRAEGPADAVARATARDPTRSFLVEAPAGSGKTSLLTARFLTVLAAVDEPESVLAITFTRKAAEEMRGRILAALRLAAGEPPAEAHQRTLYELGTRVLARDRARGWGLLDNPGRLGIQTIDALSARLARQLPLLAGATGALEVVDDAAELYLEAARLTVAELVDESQWSAHVARLLGHLDNDWAHLETLIAAMLPQREQWLRFASDTPDRAALEAGLRAIVTAELRALEAAAPRPALTALAALGRRAAITMIERGIDKSIARLAALDGPPRAIPEDQPLWAGLAELLLTANGTVRKKVDKNCGLPENRQEAAAFKADFEDLAARLAAAPRFVRLLHATRALPPARYTDAQWSVLEALYAVLKLAAAALDLVIADHGKADFVAIALAALDALGSPEQPSELVLALDRRLEHLLVDEFQDTSVVQYGLIERLTAGWTGADGRTLFLVGDPLQSIYGFRQADVRQFLAIAEAGRLGSVALERLRLTANFRSDPALIAWFNATLPACFAAAAVDLPAFVDLSAACEAKPEAGALLHALAPDADEARAVLAIVEAEFAARSDARIAVLVRSRTHLAAIPAMLAQAGFAVAAADIDPLSRLPVVGDLLALTRALLQPGDRVAWLALLRAPFVGLALEDVHVLALPDETPRTPAELWTRLAAPDAAAGLGADARRRLEHLGAVLGRAFALVGRVPLAALVEAAWVELGGARAVTDEALDHALRYFDVLGRLQRGRRDLSAATLMEAVARHYAPPAPRPGRVVEIMTIHRAKGLEFDVVIVPGLGRPPQNDSSSLLLWQERLETAGRSRLLVAPHPERGGAKDPLYTYLRALGSEARAAEAYRLLYVGVTRAKHRLHLLSGGCGADERKPRSGSLAALLWPVLGAAFEAAAAAPQAATTLARPIRTRLASAALPPPAPAFPVTARPPATVEFEWASPVAKHVGTVTHRLLQAIAEEGLQHWDAARVGSARAGIALALRSLGVTPSGLEEAVSRVADALAATLTSARGRWVLAADHAETRSEYQLSGLLDGERLEAVIDRTFVDAEGVRWIVDFKTGVHRGGALADFLDAEVERYRGQLARYGRLMAALDPRPIALGLYFPLLDAWREWRYEPAAGT